VRQLLHKIVADLLIFKPSDPVSTLQTYIIGACYVANPGGGKGGV
jgi:hypothetical protein